MEIRKGFEEHHRLALAALYYQVFGSKYEPLLGDTDQAMQILASDILPSHALVAFEEARPMGVVGFHLAGQRFVELQSATFGRVLGRFKGLVYRRLLAFFDRAPQPDELLLDGIAVEPDARGRGVGGRLLEAVKELARTENLKAVRLEVVDTNPRAKSLYERYGFEAGEVEEFPLLKDVLGFSSVTTMRFWLKPEAQPTTEDP